MHKTIIHIIRDHSQHTKKDVEEFAAMVNQGFEVMMYFNFKNEYYYILMKHTHEDEEAEELPN